MANGGRQEGGAGGRAMANGGRQEGGAGGRAMANIAERGSARLNLYTSKPFSSVNDYV